MTAVHSRAAGRRVDFGPALAVADSVLYEGYLLYPYRRSSPKNRIRWQFGVLAPRAWIEARGPVPDGMAGSAESWWNRTECLVEAGADTVVELRLRYLQPARSPSTADTPGDPGVLDAAIPREVSAEFRPGHLAGFEMVVPIGEKDADVAGLDPAGTEQGHGVLTLTAARADAPPGLYRIVVRVENGSVIDAAADRPAALRRSLVSTHLLLGVSAGRFVSLIDPPEWAAPWARECRNVRSFPVLAGPPGSFELVISAPIILDDHPAVAPESPGDLFDAAEIDEILSLRTLTLTEAEKEEARSTDPRAAEILDRVDAMPPEILGRLHGAVRSLRPRRSRPPVGGDPQVDTGRAEYVAVAGTALGPGSRVRLRPHRRGTDAQDMFLAGRHATVETVLHDVDGSWFLAVSIDGDPRAEMGAGPGRLLHFSPDEVEPA
jgi:hypothetical protein